MPPEIGALEYWENVQRNKGNSAGAEMARVLREQYGDVGIPNQLEQQQISPPPQAVLRVRDRDTLRLFVKEVIVENAHVVMPHMSDLSLDRWIRGRNILGSFLISNATERDIGEIYGINQSSVSSLLNRSISYLWQNSSEQLKKQFILPDRNTTVPSLRTEDTTRTESKPSSFRGEVLHPLLRDALLNVDPSRYIDVHPQIRQFLMQVLAEGAHLQKPTNISIDEWVRQRNITGLYFSTIASLENLGSIYNLSRERVRQIIAKTLTDLHLSLPDPLRQQFPIHDILSSQGKPVVHMYKDLLTGKYNRLVELLEQKADIGRMVDEFQVKPTTIRERLSFLVELGINVPLSLRAPRQEKNKEIVMQLQDTSLDDIEVQELLDKVTHHLYAVCVSGDNPILIPITNVASEDGFRAVNRNGPEFIKILEDAHLPIGILNIEVKTGTQKGLLKYHFIVSWHRERARQIFLEEPSLERFLENPVTQVCGPISQIPTSWHFSSKNEKRQYNHLGRIFAEFGTSPTIRTK